MKRFVYLISPNEIYPNFYKDLEKVLSSKRVSFFQLRLKNKSKNLIIKIAKKIKKITIRHKVKFIINDDPILTKKLDADGCHLGQKDTSILKARKILKNKIIGITCHNSINLMKKAIKDRVDYLAFGAFYSSQTKKIKYTNCFKLLTL